MSAIRYRKGEAMTDHGEIADRWVRWREGKVERPLMAQGGNVKVDERHPEQILSYGRHFPLAIDMGDWWLLNGDTYSTSTSRHQSLIRSAISSNSDRETMIVPFSALHGAGIDLDTIKPLDVQADTVETVTETAGPISDVPHWARAMFEHMQPGYQRRSEIGRYDDGTYWWTRRVHWLGASLFCAGARQVLPYWDRIDRTVRTVQSLFLSAFDQQERTPLYFLAQLPQDANAQTVDDAFVALRPPEVNDAMASGREVCRQGDIFAFDDGSDYIDRKNGTRKLKCDGASIEKRQRPATRLEERPWGTFSETNPADGGKVFGTRHAASEVATLPNGRVYARGCLYHDVGRMDQPDHARRRIGDGKTWHRVMPNTVPWSQGAPRAYTIRGDVD